MEPSSPRNGRLIAVTGIDGAGKSTLTAGLHRRLTTAGQPAVAVGKHTVDGPLEPQLSRYLEAVNSVVYRNRPDNGQACGDRYWLFALAAWYALQDELVVKPALAAGATVLLDNTPHKILARYAATATIQAALVEGVFADLTPPDAVVYLRITPQQALERKQGFTALEAGRPGATDRDFITYQDEVTQALQGQAEADTWLPIDVTDKTPDQVLAETTDVLLVRRLISSPPRQSVQ